MSGKKSSGSVNKAKSRDSKEGGANEITKVL